MRSDKTFGIHFTARQNQKGTGSIYARIVVDKSRCELGLKQAVDKDDWNPDRGAAKPKTPELKRLNSYLEEVRAKLVSHCQRLDLDNELITAEVVKSFYLGHGSNAATPVE
jgi:hypothetical protein